MLRASKTEHKAGLPAHLVTERPGEWPREAGIEFFPLFYFFYFSILFSIFLGARASERKRGLQSSLAIQTHTLTHAAVPLSVLLSPSSPLSSRLFYLSSIFLFIYFILHFSLPHSSLIFQRRILYTVILSTQQTVLLCLWWVSEWVSSSPVRQFRQLFVFLITYYPWLGRGIKLGHRTAAATGVNVVIHQHVIVFLLSWMLRKERRRRKSVTHPKCILYHFHTSFK